jgi:hypothetical protein
MYRTWFAETVFFQIAVQKVMEENGPETYLYLKICRKPAEENRSTDLSILFGDEDSRRSWIG